MTSLLRLAVFSTTCWVLTFGSALNASAQRTSSKSTNVELTTIPTVPVDIVDRVSFFVHADPDFFSLQDLRRYGGNMKIIKEGERLENMKYFSIGREVEVVDDGATCVVDVALGPETMGEPNIKSGPTKGNSAVTTYWAELTHTMPLRVTISDGNGNVIDGFEIDSPNQIQYGNEKVSTMDSGPLGGFTYTQETMTFDSPMDVRNNLYGAEGRRFVRRKAVLMQLSKAINELEDRLFFLETKQSVEIYVGKGKFDYLPLETAQDQALEAFEVMDLDALDGPIATWNEWAAKVDFTSKKPMVSREVAFGMHMNLAVCHLYRDEFALAGAALSAARGLAEGDGGELAKCDELQNRLVKRRRSQISNPSYEIPTKEEVEREKAPDFKDVIGKRSENKDVALIIGGDRYDDMGVILARWKAEAIAGTSEAVASSTAEMTMEQRLGAKLTSTIGGVSLTLSPFADPDLVGRPLPAEVLAIPQLVYLDLTGMKLGELPSNIDELSWLQTLIVSGNELNELPASLANIPNLKRIIARNNNLSDLPAGLERLPELKTIDLKKNNFDDGGIVTTTRRFGEDVKVKFD